METSSHSIQNPGSFEISGQLKMVLMVFTGIGALTFAAGLAVDPTRMWVGFLLNHFYFFSLALGGLFFAAIQWITGAMWSAPIRRLSESFTSYLPVVLITFGLIYFGIPKLYIWSHADHVIGDLVLEGKSGYLSPIFFGLRNVIALLLFIFFAYKMVGNSIAQDETGDLKFTLKNRVLSPIFLMIFALGYTMASFDQIMSLDPHWFSTIFGIYCFSGLFYSTLAATCLMTLYLRSKGKLKDIVNENHLHDLGKFMFAFSVFWAYIAFSQFILIWYANLPEETGYYIKRMNSGWFPITAFLLGGKFLFPFFSLLPRDAKRNPRTLMIVGIFMMFAQWIDAMWLIQPEFFATGPVLGWIELGLTLGFLGIFGLVVARFLAKHNIVAIGDPRLEESVFHHHQ